MRGEVENTEGNPYQTRPLKDQVVSSCRWLGLRCVQKCKVVVQGQGAVKENEALRMYGRPHLAATKLQLVIVRNVFVCSCKVNGTDDDCSDEQADTYDPSHRFVVHGSLFP